MSETIHNDIILTQDEIVSKLKPFSDNAVLAFFQKIWRWWLGVWSNFSDKDPKLSKFIYTFILFFLISNLVTVLQWVILLFLPQAFGIELAGQEIAWPGTSYQLFGENLSFVIFGYPVLKESGEVIFGGGLGYFYSWLIATFIAQMINFPLQRNITYRSKGNPWYQAMWYFIGWIGINLVIWIIIGNIANWNQAFIGIPREVMDLINMVIQGGVAMLIFYFIFRIIFPDVHKLADQYEVTANHKKALLEEALTTNDSVKIEDAKKAYEKAQELAISMRKNSNLQNAEKELRSLKSTSESKIIKVISINKLIENKKASNADAHEINDLENRLGDAIKLASKAIQNCESYAKEYEKIVALNA